MSHDKAAFRAIFIASRQVRDDVHFVFSVPAEKATQYLDWIGGFPKPGESRWCAIARINQTEDKAERETPSHEMAKLDKPLEQTPSAGVHNPYSRRAGILANDNQFQTWLKVPNADYAAHQIRHKCGVVSRKDILPGTDAALRFDLLQSAFVVWRDGPKHGA